MGPNDYAGFGRQPKYPLRLDEAATPAGSQGGASQWWEMDPR